MNMLAPENAPGNFFAFASKGWLVLEEERGRGLFRGGIRAELYFSSIAGFL